MARLVLETSAWLLVSGDTPSNHKPALGRRLAAGLFPQIEIVILPDVGVRAVITKLPFYKVERLLDYKSDTRKDRIQIRLQITRVRLRITACLVDINTTGLENGVRSSVRESIVALKEII